LDVAAIKDRKEIALYLIAAGADIEYKNEVNNILIATKN